MHFELKHVKARDISEASRHGLVQHPWFDPPKDYPRSYRSVD